MITLLAISATSARASSWESEVAFLKSCPTSVEHRAWPGFASGPLTHSLGGSPLRSILGMFAYKSVYKPYGLSEVVEG